MLYVDHDPVAVAHSELLLKGVPGAGVLQADLRRPRDILTSPALLDLIDLARVRRSARSSAGWREKS